ncbi:flagellar cap protein FliD N-terminal domain-containing protein, partial [Cupriavidus yeoncheonensis]|uniref:flagellar cap protein FliD N-terminal domain-containing protein n=1 Tax=Cupriavidus yeoncheonensis TaxID=1462994 RepID=UPI0023DED140
MTTISNLGVGSGLDLSSLLDQLSASEQAPLTAIQDQETSYSTKLSAYGQLSRNRSEGGCVHVATSIGLTWNPRAVARRLSAAILR